MNYEQLVAQQALKIANLEAELEGRKRSMGEIHMMLVGIGGALNDNTLGYNGAQLAQLHHISCLAAD